MTFILPQFPAAGVAGRPCPFTYRDHTNNYGVAARVCHGDVIVGMKDHITASAFAGTRNFRDCCVNAPLGCTIKTPCPANMMWEWIRDGLDLARPLPGSGRARRTRRLKALKRPR